MGTMTEPSPLDAEPAAGMAADLAALVELVPHAMLVHDTAGRLLVANPAGVELLGDRVEPIGGPLPWIGPVERPVTVDMQVTSPTGAIRWMTAQSHPIEHAGRSLVATTVLDLTERQGWAQSAIEGVIQRFELSWARSHLPVFLVRIDDHGFGRVLVSNAALQELVGGAEQVNGQHLGDLFAVPGVEGVGGVDALLRRLMASEDQGPTMTSRVRRPDGSSPSVLLGLTVARGPVGRPLFVLGYAIDQSPLEASEEARRRELAHTELIYEYGTDVVVVISAEGRFQFIGPSSLDVLGYDRHDLIGDIGFELVHPDDRDLAMEALASTATKPGVAPPLNVRIRDGYEDWRPVEMVARNLLDVPDVEGIVLTIRDRSDQARAEAEREEQERQNRQIVELAADGIASLDAGHRIVYVNRRLASMLGYPAEDLVGRPVTDLVAPWSREAAIRHLWEAHADGDRLRIDLQHRDGSCSAALIAATQRQDGIDLVRSVVWFTDLSEVEAARADLERNEQRMRALFEAHPDLIFRLGSDGTYLDFHSTDESLLVLPPERFIGKTVHRVLSEDYAPGAADAFMAAITEVLAGADISTVNYTLPLPDGPHQFEARLAQISEHEVIAVVRDTSDLHRSEQRRVEHERELVRQQAELERASLERELERASRIEAMGYLAATMAHDVNNLLGVINNYASSIRRSQPGWSVQRDAEEISAAVARGAELTQRLLRIGRRPTELLSVEPVSDLVRSLAESLQGAFDRETGVGLVTELPDGPATVRGSRPRIEQAVMNLVLNARDAAEAAGGRVVVTLSVESRHTRECDWRPDRVGPGEYVVVSVVDGGGGIPEQVRERIFEPFFSTKEGANSGLGLPIVREVAEQHGGGVGIHAVEVDGVPGTRMELWLPAVPPPPSCPRPIVGPCGSS
jgi:two-component system, cell cycle sensor histidine kinase and response regulator CckA